MLGVFGINSQGLNLAVNLLILFLVVIYLALVYWTYTDALRRIADPVLVVCATVASLIPFVGPVLYVIVRPPEYLDDIRERELEMQASEARLADLNYMLCPHCDHEVEKDFLRCPTCLRRLRAPCGSCRRPLEPAWKVCPYCEAELPGAGAEGRVRRRATAGEP
ncbi:MAG: zinc ribbon domain-containing protein [Solirubrobacteraceae bacterium]